MLRGCLGWCVKLCKYFVEINVDEIIIILLCYIFLEVLECSIMVLVVMIGYVFLLIKEECVEFIDKLDWLCVENDVI